MFKNKNNSSNNICGKNVHKYRLENFPHLSQRMLAERLQLAGLDLDKNAISASRAGSVLSRASNSLPCRRRSM